MKNNVIKGLFAGAFLLAISLLYASDRHGTRLAPELLNFHQVNEALYRGAQPDAVGFRRLARLGVKMVVNLRMTNDLWAPEPIAVREVGMVYTNVPLSSIERPTDAQVARVLSIIENAPGPVFIHCQYGSDRTGTIIACYRIKHDHWSPEAALEEANQLGLSPYEVGMRQFVLDFKKADR